MDHPKFRRDAAGNLLLNFGAYGEEVEVAAISGDGRRILTVRDVGRAQVWDANGTLVSEIAPESPLQGSGWTAPGAGDFQLFIESASLNRDGSLALLGLNDGTAAVYRVEGGVRLAVLHPPGEEPAQAWTVIRAARYSPDGTFAVVGFPGRRVGVWSADGSRLIAFLGANLGKRLVGNPFVRDTLVCSVSASPNNHAVFAGAVDLTAAVFDVGSGSVVFEATEHAEDVLGVFDNENGIGWATTAGRVWRSRDGAPVQRELDTGEHWSEVVFDGEQLLARSHGGRVLQWSLGGERTVLFDPPESDYCGWSREARTLDLRGTFKQYPESGQRLVLRDGVASTVIECDAQLVAASISPMGDVLATRGWTDCLELWDTRTGELMRVLPCRGWVGCFAFSPDATLVALGEIGQGAGRYDRHVYVYDVRTGKRRWRLTEHDRQIQHVEFSTDGQLLVSLGHDVVVWRVAELALFRKRPVLRLRVDSVVGQVCFVGNDLLLLDEGVVRMFDGITERLKFEAPIAFRTPWTVSHDRRYLTVAGNQAVVRFDLQTGAVERRVEAPIDRPHRLPPLPLAAQHEVRGGALLWRTAHGSFLHQSDGPRGWVEPLELSPDGLVAVPCADGAAVFRVLGDGTEVVGKVPFEGKLHAGRCVNGEVILVNQEGRIFRAAVPGSTQPS